MKQYRLPLKKCQDRNEDLIVIAPQSEVIKSAVPFGELPG